MGDSVDLLPEVFVGRAPVSRRDPAAWFADKTVSYCSDSTAPYLRNLLLAGFDLDTAVLGETTMELYDSLFVPEVMKPANKVYDSHTGNHKQDVLDLLNEGQNVFVNWDHGHYNAYGCGWENHGWTITQMEMYGLTNAGRYGIYMSGGCYTGRFDTLDCIAAFALAAPDGGAVAAIGNTRYGLAGRHEIRNPQRWLTPLQMERVMSMMVAPGRNTSLETFTTAKASLAPLADTSEPDRWCIYTFTLFGEPCMPVWVPELSTVEEKAEGGGIEAELRIPTVMRGPELARLDVHVLDITGRDVTEDRPRFPPGVYFVRPQATGRLHKVIVSR
jgi:hypothetical protein